MDDVGRDFFVPDVGDVVSCPDAFGAFRCFLEYDEVFGGSARAVAHADAGFVPG